MPGPGQHVLDRAKARRREHGLLCPSRDCKMGGAWNQAWPLCGRMLLVLLTLYNCSLASVSGRVPMRRRKGSRKVENHSHQRVPRPVQRKALLAALLGARLPQDKVGSHGEEIAR